MREFFHDWRRKAGLVTLVMALVFMGLWLRSFAFWDKVRIPSNGFESNNGGVAWSRMYDISGFSLWSWTTSPVAPKHWNDVGNSWKFTEGTWSVPYWVIAIPFTLLSAYLIFSKPRRVPELDRRTWTLQEFLKGWRRKTGCVILMIACTVVGMWLRSHIVRDGISDLGDKGAHSLYSVNGTIRWTQWLGPERNPYHEPVWYSLRSDTFQEPQSIIWSRQWCFIHRRESDDRPWFVPGRTRELILPYWFVVIPLTLLSAYLLLWKPRKRTGADHA